MNKKKGSAILIVIILSVALSCYISGAIMINNNFSILTDEYKQIIEDYYTKDLNNLHSIYDSIDLLNK